MPFFGSRSENRGSSHLRIKTQVAITEVDVPLNQMEILSIGDPILWVVVVVSKPILVISLKLVEAKIHIMGLLETQQGPRPTLERILSV